MSGQTWDEDRWMADVRAQYAELSKLMIAREGMVRRIFTEPVPHAVAEILRRVRDAEGPDRETAIVDGTVAIMELMEGVERDRASRADTPEQG